jgi:3-oxoacyl-[acyl-carrier protein] reductase
MKLSGKIALVTGASKGIGRQIAVRLAADGALVAVHYGRDSAGASRTIDEIAANGGCSFSLQADLAGSTQGLDDMFAAFDRALASRTGQCRFDILINNAGHLVPFPIESTSPADFDALFAVNVRAPFYVTQKALPRLRDGGRIINISSGVARIATPQAIAYAMTKGALNVFSKTLAQHLGPRQITVNSVAPGLTATDELLKMVGDDRTFLEAGAAQSALGRLGRPADIADVVAFIASEEARWITGQVVDATGGAALC